MRVEFVAAERLLEFLLQGIQSILGILFFVFLSIEDLCDEIIKFHEDRHNRNCIYQFLTGNLDIPDELTIPSTILVEELHFQWQQWARYIRFKAEPECIDNSPDAHQGMR